MAKKSAYLFYFILALSLIIFGSLSLTFFKINIIEAATSTNNDADDFAVAMNIKLNSSKGKIVPYPLGSYTVTTSSGQYSATTDFSMNQTAQIKTKYDIDASQNIVDRIITIAPKNTGGSTNINIGDVITNRFQLDISFNQIEYKLNTLADIKGKNLTAKKDQQVIADNLNYIDANNNLNITALGTIYNANKGKIGEVTQDDTDTNNTKTYAIKMLNPSDTNYKLKSIIIKFMVPVPAIDMESLPPVPPGVDPSISKNFPAANPNLNYSDPDSL
jgi:hypothetical protein